MKEQNSKQNASTTESFQVVIPKYDFKRPAKIFGGKVEIKASIIQSDQSKSQNILVQNLSLRILRSKSNF